MLLAEFYADSIRRQVDLRTYEIDWSDRKAKKISGRGPPTAPTLRPRVLTPRDHFVHRGGGRSRIMQQSD
jgi:hypothetical protein